MCVTEQERYIESVQAATGFDAPFCQGVVDLLAAMGYTLQDGDCVFLAFVTRKVEEQIKNSCNISSVPEGLKCCATGLILAEFLLLKKGMGELDGFALSFEPVVKQLQEGDTNIVWATDSSMTTEQRLDSLIAYLLSFRDQFVTYRRIKW